jgi:protein-tyrosine phosphatase
LYDPTRIDITFDPRLFIMRGVATHGRTPFECPYISHIKDNLWQGGCANDLRLPREIEHVISLYKWERYKLEPGHELATFEEVTAYDSDDPETLGGMSVRQVLDLAALVNRCREQGPTLVHCQAGLNRSGLIAAVALILNGDVSCGEDAVALLRETRSPAVLCNRQFESWLVNHFPRSR